MSDYYTDPWADSPLGQLATKERHADKPSVPAAGDGVQQVQRTEAGHSSVRPMRKPRVSTAADDHRARERDPITSHEAGAKHSKNARHYELIEEALRLGPAGATEIAARTGLKDNVVVCRRLKEMRVDLCTVEYTGRKVINSKGNSEYEYRLRLV
jgi:hypothetical protein